MKPLKLDQAAKDFVQSLATAGQTITAAMAVPAEILGQQIASAILGTTSGLNAISAEMQTMMRGVAKRMEEDSIQMLYGLGMEPSDLLTRLWHERADATETVKLLGYLRAHLDTADLRELRRACERWTATRDDPALQTAIASMMLRVL